MAVTVAGLCVLRRGLKGLVNAVPDRVSEPEIKFVLLVLLGLGGLATAANSVGSTK